MGASINVSGGGGSGSTENTFETIQTPAGTSPVAESSTDTLTLTSTDSSVTITGDSTTDTIDFSVDVDDILPSQGGNSGKFLTTNGTIASWGAVSATVTDSLNALILNPIDRTYVLDSYAPAAYTINSIGIKCSTGTCTAKIQIGGVDVTSLTGLSVSSANTTATATGANSVVAGDRVTLVLTSTSVIQDLEMTLKVTR